MTSPQREFHIQTTDPVLPSSLQRSFSAVSPPTPSSVVEPQSVSWPGWLWGGGAILLLAKAFLARLSLARARRKAQPASEQIVATVARLCRELGIPRPVVVTWKFLPGPAAFGIARPVIALPLQFAEKFTLSQQEAIIAHELAHLAARDPLWFLLGEIVCALLWWHPALWWARHRQLVASEFAADEGSHLVSNGHTALAEALLILGQELGGPGKLSYPVQSTGGIRSQLGRRIRTLLHESSPWRKPSAALVWSTRFAALSIVILLVTLLPQTAMPNPFLVLSLSGSPKTDPIVVAETSSSNQLGTLTGIMTDPQLRTAVKALETAKPDLPPSRTLQAEPSQPNSSRPVDGATIPASALTSQTPRNENQNGSTLDQPETKIAAEEERAVSPQTAGASLSRSADPSPAITLRLQIAEISETGTVLGLDWLFGKIPAEEPESFDVLSTNFVPGTGLIHGKDVAVEYLRLNEQYALLSKEQYSGLKAALERQFGVDFLTAPVVTTLSGRQAQISVLDIHTVVTDQPDPKDRKAEVGAETVSFGQVVDLNPRFDNGVWQIRVVASFIEFLGYSKTPNSDGVLSAKSVARIRVRDAAANAGVPLGHTMVLRGVPVTEMRSTKRGFFRKPQTQEVKKRRYIFLTPETN